MPLFVFVFGMDQASAQGTALALMVPNLILGWLRYQQRLLVPWLPIIILATSATATTYLVANLALLLDPKILQIIFNLFLITTGLRMWHDSMSQSRPTQPTKLKLSRLPFVGVAGGSSMGLLGMGGGLVATPMLAIWLRQPQVTAQSLSLSLVTPCSIVALGTYAEAQKVDWGLGLPMSIGGILAVSAGVATAHYLPEKTLKKLFSALLCSVGAILLTHSM